MSKLVAVSYSRLGSFETCPKKYYEISVRKSFSDPPNEHTSYGTEVHQAFANYMRAPDAVLPMSMKQYEGLLLPIRASAHGTGVETAIEQKLAVTADFKPTGWFDKDVYIRVISDMTTLYHHNKRGVLWDWKTGKLQEGFTQLQLSGIVTFMLAPDINELKLAYLWTKEKKVTHTRMKREDIIHIWSDLQPRLQHYQDAHVAVDFPPKPSYLCRYCPVKTCAFWEKR